MITYDEFLKEFSKTEKIIPFKLKRDFCKYYVVDTKKTLIKPFENLTEAQEYLNKNRLPFSSLITEDTEDWHNYQKERLEQQSRIFQLFREEIKKDYLDLPDGLFDFCWTAAETLYSGPDDIANNTVELVDFVIQCKRFF